MPMSSVIRPTLQLYPKTFFQTKSYSPKSPIHRPSFLTIVKCTTYNNNNNNGSSEQSFNLKGALNDAVGESVVELLKREENKALLDSLEMASLRVDKARRELAEIERQELEAKQARAYIDELEKRASEIADCQKEIVEARAMVDEAERSLSQISNPIGDKDGGGEEVVKNKERIESIKAASIAAIVGTLSSLPVTFTQVSDATQLILPISITIASCALFGVTYRYVVRRDLDDVHLKSGAWAAFGIVKGLGTLIGSSEPLELNTESLVSHAVDGALYISQNLFVFVSAALSLDYCFKLGILSPFPMKSSTSRTNDE